MREAQGWALETLPGGLGQGGFIFSVGYTYASTTSPPFICGPCLALPLLWNLLGPLSNGEVGGGESWPHALQGQCLSGVDQVYPNEYS